MKQTIEPGLKFIRDVSPEIGRQMHVIIDIQRKGDKNIHICEWGVFIKKQQILTETEIKYWIEKYSTNFQKTC